MRTLGAGKYADNLITAMNRAAEMAAAEGKPLLLEAVEKMPVEDALKSLAAVTMQQLNISAIRRPKHWLRNFYLL